MNELRLARAILSGGITELGMPDEKPDDGKRRVRLTTVDGDQEGFADLIGWEGILHKTSSGLSFQCDNGEWLRMHTKRMTIKDGKIRISTKLGNTFTFKIL